MPGRSRTFVVISSLGAALGIASPVIAGERMPLPRFKRIVIDADFPGGYQVEVADVNGDGKPDIVGVGGGTCAWYENPIWTKRVVTGPKQTPDIISSATADLDGDGKAEIAIAFDFAMDEPARGKLTLAAQGRDADAPWTLTPIADVPSIHRLRWGDVDGDKRPELVVAPIFGRDAKPPRFDQDPARLVAFRTGDDPKSGRWTAMPVGKRPVIHAIEVRNLGDGGGVAQILTADNLGVGGYGWLPFNQSFQGGTVALGAPGESPKRGSSEVHFGRLAGGGNLLATIDPWHGNEVAIRLALPSRLGRCEFLPRIVIDDSLKDGHALWLADVDGDGDDEIFAGYRGPGTSVLAFDFDGKTWTRTVLDPEIAAQDLRGGDLDGDGTPDVVAIGGKTHNVVWYRPICDRKP